MTFVLFILFIIGLGFGIGGMLISRRTVPQVYILLSIAILFLFLGYIGILLGNFMFSWLANSILHIMIGIFLILFVIFLLLQFHPVLGFFHGNGKLQWVILFLLFLLVGMDFSKLELSNWFIIIIGLLFLIAMMLGANMIYRLVSQMRSHSNVIFLPALFLIFLGILKLL
ncbi:hypothetical protein ACJ2A9_05325 [Anaerobacillus sp. MEB173]|uniref:hypothetical protein n=1 Tax=Anaerobacillus sp. MEB173 TaxID=3383345 RepID=UPI003F8FF26E